MRVYYLSNYFNQFALDCWLEEVFSVSSISHVSCFVDADLVIAPGACNSGQISTIALKRACREENKKVLCICGGFQALFGSNEESGEIGAEIFNGTVVKLKKDNGIEFAQTGMLKCKDNNEYFFNNCYGVVAGPLKKQISTLFHGKFIIMIQSDNILGYQFHPELSGKAQKGLKTQMRSWLYGS